ncbi:hypothetical protein UVI_02046530 [Ustilaginoidea virens]|uniref:Uncharacterized protein n=1 Tax=Ustilaginoidea virens TaxID=1159556 RepID=A0A1B5L341_USTVR|nr:hypothetical protein UVI_02046530 [Ustilaginoidea virens]
MVDLFVWRELRQTGSLPTSTPYAWTDWPKQVLGTGGALLELCPRNNLNAEPSAQCQLHTVSRLVAFVPIPDKFRYFEVFVTAVIGLVILGSQVPNPTVFRFAESTVCRVATFGLMYFFNAPPSHLLVLYFQRGERV